MVGIDKENYGFQKRAQKQPCDNNLSKSIIINPKNVFKH